MRITSRHRVFAAAVVMGLALVLGLRVGPAEAQVDGADMTRFIENLGQWDPAVEFRARVTGMTVWFTNDRIVYEALQKPEQEEPDDEESDFPSDEDPDEEPVRSHHVVEARFVNPNPNAEVLGGRVQPGVFNWIRGENGADSITGARWFGTLAYENLWPNIDVRVRQPGEVRDGVHKLVYLISPGGDPDDIEIEYVGADGLGIDERDGSLSIATTLGTITEKTPFAFQLIGEKQVPVTVRFVLEGNRVRFDVGEYDTSEPLVIDPSVIYSRTIGGTSDDYVFQVREDQTGVYIAGVTESSNFPTTPGAFDQNAGNFTDDGYAAKLDSSDGDLIWSTFVTITNDDTAFYDLIVDGGEPVLVGFADGSGYPTTPGAYQTSSQSSFNDQGILTRLNSSGSALVCSTYVAATNDFGDSYITGIAMAADGSGDYYGVGMTENDNGWPNTGGFQPNDPSGFFDDGFVVRMSNDCSTLQEFTYLGGAGDDSFTSGVAVDASGVYAASVTESPGWPTTPGAFQPTRPAGQSSFDDDITVNKLSPDLGTNIYGTYLGGMDDENNGDFVPFSPSGFSYTTVASHNIAVRDGLAHVVGLTESSDFPTTPNALIPNKPNPDTFTDEGFVTVLNADGSGLVSSTFLGAGGTFDDDVAKSVVIDDSDNVHVVGWTESDDFPVVNAVQPNKPAPGTIDDGFHTLLSPDLSTLLCGTYIGASDDDTRANSVFARPILGQAIVAGWTEADNFPQEGGGPIGSAPTFSENGFVQAISCASPLLVEQNQETVPISREGFDCLAAGDLVNYTFEVTNTGLLDQPDLPGPEVEGVLTGAGRLVGCETSSGTCEVTADDMFQWNGSVDVGEVIEFSVQARITGGLPAGEIVCLTNTLNFNTSGELDVNDTSEEQDAICAVLDCPPVDPNRQLGRQVHLPVLNFQGQEEACDTWIEVQNIGPENSKAVLVTWSEPGFCPPQCAGPLKVECTGLLKPGSTWNFLGAQVPTGAKSGMLFKFTARQLSEIGVDIGDDDIVADAMCETLFFGVVGDCDDYRRFKKAYNDGLDFGSIPQDLAAGFGVLAVDVLRTCPADTTLGVDVTSKYNGIAGSHLGRFDPVYGGYATYAPLVYADQGGFNSVLYIQNGGLECSSVEVWFKAQDDCLRARICEVFALAPGETFQFDASDCVGPDWQGSAWIRTSQPTGVVVDIIGRDVLMTYSGEPAAIQYTFDPTPPGQPFYNEGSQVLYGPLIYSEYQGWDSGVQVQNLSSTSAAKVKVYFLDRSGDIVTTLVDWICPRGSQTFFLPVIHNMPGNWAGSMRVESQEWWSPGDPVVLPASLSAVATLIEYNDAARTETTQAIAYNLLPEHKAFEWQAGLGGGGLDSGIGLIAVPSLLKDLDNTGVTSELAITNVVPKPGFTDFAIYIYDQNGLIDYVCEKLNEKQVEYIDLQTWGYVNPGFKGSAVISAVFWEHEVFDGDFFLRNALGLTAVAVERSGTRLGEDVPGDEAAGARGIPFRIFFEDPNDRFEFAFMGATTPACPGVPGEEQRRDPFTCQIIGKIEFECEEPECNRPLNDGQPITSDIIVSPTFELLEGCTTVTDVDVRIWIQHPTIDDIGVANLTSPEVGPVTLFSSICPVNAIDIEATLDDAATQVIGSVCPPQNFLAYHTPGRGLQQFEGTEPFGTWTLNLADTNFNFIEGQLRFWSLIMELE